MDRSYSIGVRLSLRQRGLINPFASTQTGRVGPSASINVSAWLTMTEPGSRVLYKQTYFLLNQKITLPHSQCLILLFWLRLLAISITHQPSSLGCKSPVRPK